jgi:hypothetical protein
MLLKNLRNHPQDLQVCFSFLVHFMALPVAELRIAEW